MRNDKSTEYEASSLFIDNYYINDRARRESKTIHHSPLVIHQKNLVKRIAVLVGAAEEHLNGQVRVLYIVVALGVVTFCPDADGDLLGLELVEVEEAGLTAEALVDVEGGLPVDRGALVGLPDRGGTAVLIGYTDRLDDIGFCAGLGGGAGGGGVAALDLNRLTGQMDIHIGGSDEPHFELEERRAFVRAAG